MVCLAQGMGSVFFSLSALPFSGADGQDTLGDGIHLLAQNGSNGVVKAKEESLDSCSQFNLFID